MNVISQSSSNSIFAENSFRTKLLVALNLLAITSLMVKFVFFMGKVDLAAGLAMTVGAIPVFFGVWILLAKTIAIAPIVKTFSFICIGLLFVTIPTWLLLTEEISNISWNAFSEFSIWGYLALSTSFLPIISMFMDKKK